MVDKKATKEPKAKKEKKEKKAYAAAMPKTADDSGALFKLGPKDFPNSKEGKLGYIDYRIARLQQQRDRIAKHGDVNQKKAAKLEKLRKQLAELEAELSKGV